jgi:hypothetical protein
MVLQYSLILQQNVEYRKNQFNQFLQVEKLSFPTKIVKKQQDDTLEKDSTSCLLNKERLS